MLWTYSQYALLVSTPLLAHLCALRALPALSTLLSAKLRACYAQQVHSIRKRALSLRCRASVAPQARSAARTAATHCPQTAVQARTTQCFKQAACRLACAAQQARSAARATAMLCLRTAPWELSIRCRWRQTAALVKVAHLAPSTLQPVKQAALNAPQGLTIPMKAPLPSLHARRVLQVMRVQLSVPET